MNLDYVSPYKSWNNFAQKLFLVLEFGSKEAYKNVCLYWIEEEYLVPLESSLFY